MGKINITCIIDDDPIYVYGAKVLMQLSNFCDTLLEFNNGVDALEKLTEINNSNEELPDVILLDLNMPVMDGWEFLDEFTKIRPKKMIKIYIVTSSIDPQDIEKAKTYNDVCNYLVKPITSETLEEILIKH